MSKEEITAKIQSIKIENPCSVDWNNMSGSDCKRFCDQCSENVHFISAMPDTEIIQLIDRKATGERTCMFMLRDQSGMIITDNWPTLLKPVAVASN